MKSHTARQRLNSTAKPLLLVESVITPALYHLFYDLDLFGQCSVICSCLNGAYLQEVVGHGDVGMDVGHGVLEVGAVDGGLPQLGAALHHRLLLLA